MVLKCANNYYWHMFGDLVLGDLIHLNNFLHKNTFELLK